MCEHPYGNMNKRTVFLIGVVALARQTVAACVAEGPVETARWIYTNQSGFSVYQFPQDLKLMARFLSPRLLGLLEVEWRCQVVSEGSCAIDTDSWTNTEAGAPLNPVTFDLVTLSGLRSTVRMHFGFRSGEGNQAKTLRARAVLNLARDTKSGCWQLDDLVGMHGQSLVEQLQSYADLYP